MDPSLSPGDWVRSPVFPALARTPVGNSQPLSTIDFPGILQALNTYSLSRCFSLVSRLVYTWTFQCRGQWLAGNFAHSASISSLFPFKESPSSTSGPPCSGGHQEEQCLLSDPRNDSEMSCDPNEPCESPRGAVFCWKKTQLPLSWACQAVRM